MEIVRIVVTVLLVLSSVTTFNAATTPPSSTVGDAHSLPCIQKLMPCQPYLHTAAPQPPPTCCLPLKEIVENDVTCLCSVFNNVDMLKSLNLTKENALVLPNACGAKADVSKCKASSGSTTTPPATPTTPPASSTGTGSGSTGDSASSTAKSSDSAPPINFVGLSFASAFMATLFF